MIVEEVKHQSFNLAVLSSNVRRYGYLCSSHCYEVIICTTFKCDNSETKAYVDCVGDLYFSKE